mgnify:FL=1
MATHYHVYANDHAGGPVDYGSVVATVTVGTTYAAAALSTSTDTTFAVRAFDSVSGHEEKNVDCRVRIVIDAAGVDVTGRPNAPYGLRARATAGGGATAEWAYNSASQGGAPTGFKVWLTLGDTPNYVASPAATVAYSTGTPYFRATLTGLTDATEYVVAVRAYNAAGNETNTSATSLVVGDSTGPDSVDDLTATAV